MIAVQDKVRPESTVFFNGLHTQYGIGNRTSERVNQPVTGTSYNNVNELTGQGGSGPLRFRDSVDEPVANLTVGGNTATVDTNRNFHFTGDDFGPPQQRKGLRTRYDYDP